MSSSLASDIDVVKRLDPRVASLWLFFILVWVLAFSLPDGINQKFLSQLLIPACMVAAIALLVSMFVVKAKAQPVSANKPQTKFPFGDLLLVSLPMTPIAQFVMLNQDSLNSIDNLALVVVSCLLFALAAIVLPWALKRWLSYPEFLILVLALSYSLGNMAAMARANHWHLAGEFLPQFVLFLTVLALSGLLYRVDRTALRALALCFLIATIVHTWWQEPTEGLEATASAEETFYQKPRPLPWNGVYSEQQIKHKPDIFLLTYDSYVENETMLQYGIDNSVQEQYLQDLGFQLYPGIYSVGSASKSSMSRVLGAKETSQGVAGFSPMLDVLKSNGYTTMGLFKNDYFFRGVGVGYDQSFPPPSRPSLVLARAVVEGQFRHNVSFATAPHSEFVRSKRQAIKADSPSPKFMYTHTGPEHSQNSGECRQDEVSLFRKRLEEANLEMRADLEAIQENHPDALIVINGDHGPYLTKNCTALSEGQYAIEEVTTLDIQDRFGAFLAIRWPQGQQEIPDAPLLVLQDIFPAVFAYLYEQPIVDSLRVAPNIGPPWNHVIGGVSIAAGKVEGGSEDGEMLYQSLKP